MKKDNSTKKTLLPLPSDFHAAIRLWCSLNGDTLGGFCHQAIIERCHKLGIKPYRGGESVEKILWEERLKTSVLTSDNEGFNSYSEALNMYRELRASPPPAQPLAFYGGSIRINVRGEFLLAYTPACGSQPLVKQWREEYIKGLGRAKYLSLANTSIFLLELPPTQFA